MIQDILAQAETLYQIAKHIRQEELEPHGINYRQYRVLAFISESEVTNPSKISSELHYDRPTTTILLKQLEDGGWIQREINPLNRRYVHVKLTSKGKTRIKSILSQSTTNDLFSRALDAQEMKLLTELLNKLLKAV